MSHIRRAGTEANIQWRVCDRTLIPQLERQQKIKIAEGIGIYMAMPAGGKVPAIVYETFHLSDCLHKNPTSLKMKEKR